MATITKNGITLSTDSGSGDATITVTADKANLSSYPRTAYFTISTKTGLAISIKVTQQGAGTIQIGGNTEVTNPDIRV